MSVCLALFLFAAAPQTAPALTVDGLLNGGFERVLDNGHIGEPAGGVQVDGAFWVGAEGRTVELAGGARALRLANECDPPCKGDEFAYQRVGAARDRTDSARLTGRVFVPGPVSAKHEARVTFSGGSGQHWELDWALTNFFVDGDLDPSQNLIRWSAFYSADGGQTRNPMVWSGGEFASGDFLIDQRGAFIGPSKQIGQESWIEIVWLAPKDGWVRAMNRPWKRDPVGEDVRYEIWKYAGGVTPTWIRTDWVATGDVNGPQAVARIRVNAGDEVRFRAIRPNLSTRYLTVDIADNPLVAYEGPSLTYRFGHQLDSVPDTAFERFRIVPLASAQLDQWAGFQLTAGADFADPTIGFGALALPPLDVKLSTPVVAPQTNVVMFDDVRMLLDFARVSEKELRAQALAEGRWARDLMSGVNACANGEVGAGVLDLDTRGCQRGPLATPYRAHGLFIRDGRRFFDELGPQDQDDCRHRVQVDAPRGMWELLQHEFDPWYYNAYFAIREAMMHKDNLSPAGFMYTKYDVLFDEYLRDQYPWHPCGAYPDGVPDPADYEGGEASAPYLHLVKLYQHTNHPHFLDRAVKSAFTFDEKGVLVETNVPPDRPDRTGFIAYRGYDMETGDLIWPDHETAFAQLFGSSTGDAYKPKNNLTAFGELVQIYASARIFNLVKANRFPAADLDDLATKLNAHIQAGIKARNPVNFLNCGTWADKWPEGNSGKFNDHWGNQGQDALFAYDELRKLEAVRSSLGMVGLTADEQAILDAVMEYWLREGTEYFWSDWEQQIARGAFLPGDHARGWPMYQRVVQDPRIPLSDPALRQKFETQVIEAALYATKFQYVHRDANGDPLDSGIWTSGPLGRFQILDISKKNLNGASNYAYAASIALTMPGIARNTKNHVLSVLSEQIAANIRHFKADDPMLPGEADGYGYWPSAFKTEPPTGGDWEAAWEWRPIQSFLDVLGNLSVDQFCAPIPAPTPKILPETYKQNGNEVYSFTLRWPTNLGVTQAQMSEQLNQRTIVFLWYEDAQKGWTRDVVYSPYSPPGPNGVPLASHTYPDATSIRIETQIPVNAPASGKELELEIVTWDVEGVWRRDTSFQETP